MVHCWNVAGWKLDDTPVHKLPVTLSIFMVSGTFLC